ncbi:MAG: hypothetical protein KTR31_25950 [Myxococcales bacterium]|nr:hypothetical protein [Myxococcales bacterium]
MIGGWRRRLFPNASAVLHLGLGSQWFWLGRPAVSDGERLWWCRGARVFPLPWPGVQQVQPCQGGVEAWLADGRHVRAGVRGHEVVRRGCRIAGRTEAWASEGYLYARTAAGVRALDVIRPSERVVAGGGWVLLGSETLSRAARTGATPAPLGLELQASSVRVGRRGRVQGLDATGARVTLDLQRGTARLGEGLPVGPEHHVDAHGRLRRGQRVYRRGLVEASCARWEDLLAGPAGVVWSLTTGRPLFRRPAIRLGVTVGSPAGFVTVDWDTHEGVTVDPHTGQQRDAFRLPLEPEDTVVAGSYADGAVHLTTALGVGLRVVGGRVETSQVVVAEPAAERVLVTDAGDVPCADIADVGGHRFGWTEDGWLLAIPRS